MSAQGQGTAVYALTRAGARSAVRLAREMDGGELFLPGRLASDFPGAVAFDRLAQALAANFERYDGHVLFCAAGIVVRALAPLLQDKTRDPAVVVADQEGRHAVSLLSGHLGGANDLARKVAAILGGRAVITTATDIQGLPSLETEAVGLGCGVENIRALAKISSDLLDGVAVRVFDPGGWIRPVLERWPGLFEPLEQARGDEPKLVWVGWEALDPPPGWLILRPPCLALGIGCNRDTPAQEIQELFQEVFGQEGLSPACVFSLASVEAKRDEPGLLEFGRSLGLEPLFYGPDQLNEIEVPNPSAMVRRHLGVESVCEAAAILAADRGRLLVQKRKTKNVTLAVGLAGSSS